MIYQTKSNSALRAIQARADFYESVKNIFAGVCFGALFFACLSPLYL
jgi:hypothetical protein